MCGWIMQPPNPPYQGGVINKNKIMRTFNVSFALWYIKHRRLIDWSAIIVLIALNVGIEIYFLGLATKYFLAPAPSAPDILVNFPKRNVPNENLEAGKAAFLPAGDQYNLVAEVRNPNTALALRSFHYQFTLLGGRGETLAVIPGESYLFPGETKYIIRTEIDHGKDKAQDLDFKIDGLGYWASKSNVQIYPLSILEDQTNFSLNSAGQLELFAIAQNQSDYNFRDTEIAVVVWGRNQQILEVNYTTLNNFYAKTKREFRMRWARDFRPEMERIEIRPQTNIYDPNNFLELEKLKNNPEEKPGEYRDI